MTFGEMDLDPNSSKFNDVSKITSNAKLYYTVLMVIEEMTKMNYGWNGMTYIPE